MKDYKVIATYADGDIVVTIYARNLWDAQAKALKRFPGTKQLRVIG